MDDKPKGKLRTGFTTGACSSAAAKAATLVLLDQKSIQEVEIALPIGKRVTFKVQRCEFSATQATCSVIKDAGDDPDCTHGAHLTATVSWLGEPKILLEPGSGVGVITKPGLGLDVGGPAINPVPRKNITAMIQEALGAVAHDRGVQVILSVPGGEEMAKKTLNARLGILGGISILGTTGIVVPFSTAAYKASITQGIDVALSRGLNEIVLTTGGKSEQFAMKQIALPEEAFIQMGDFSGFSLLECVKRKVKKVYLCGMPGKMSKIAMGVMQTHASGSEVDMNFLAGIAQEIGAETTVVNEVLKANTARHVLEIVQRYHLHGFFDRVAQRVCQAAQRQVKQAMAVECLITDFEGNVIGRAESA